MKKAYLLLPSYCSGLRSGAGLIELVASKRDSLDTADTNPQ